MEGLKMPALESNLTFLLDKTPEEILEYFRELGIVLDDDWDDFISENNHNAFKIASINKANLLLIAKNIIEDAIAKGTDLKEFKNRLKEELGLRDWHAKLVVTQNISNSYNAGRYIIHQDAKDKFPYLRPVVTLDNKTTDICSWLSSSKMCLRADDPKLHFMYSPRHFKCRTIWVAITDLQKERMGLKVMNVKDISDDKLNHKDFRKLPTKMFTPDLKKYPKQLANKLEEALK